MLSPSPTESAGDTDSDPEINFPIPYESKADLNINPVILNY